MLLQFMVPRFAGVPGGGTILVWILWILWGGGWGGVFARAEKIFTLLVCERVRTWSTVLIAHPSNVFCVSHLDFPLAILFNDMGSSLATHSGLLVHNGLSYSATL